MLPSPENFNFGRYLVQHTWNRVFLYIYIYIIILRLYGISININNQQRFNKRKVFQFC